MIQNNSNNVSFALESLIEEVEAETDFVNNAGSKQLQIGPFSIPHADQLPGRRCQSRRQAYAYRQVAYAVRRFTLGTN